MVNTIENNICSAIEIIVNRAIEQASFDKTIQVTIVSCEDESTGKYRVKYQDSIFYAYSTDTSSKYSSGTSVYVLVPANDMSKTKTIIGSVNKLGTDYISTIEADATYDYIGANCITSSNEFTLCSYKKGKYTKVLYSKDNAETGNLITLDKTAASEYLGSAETLICGITVRTDLPLEQQSAGNYGIMFALDYADNATGETVTRYYTIDVNSMTGNPYKLINDTRQYGIFDIDGENFKEVNYIALFTYDFPNSKDDSELVDDIFIKNIELWAAEENTESTDGYALSLLTPQGTFFDSSTQNGTLTIQAQYKLNGKLVSGSSLNSIDYYWFTEHAGITNQSDEYCRYGGQGWKCLNDYNVISEATEDSGRIVAWIPADDTWTVAQSAVAARQVTYKCVAVYNDTVVSKTVIIKNLASDYDITIESDNGTQFYYDIGNFTLTCLVNDKENSNYTYSWSVTDNNGAFESLVETTEANTTYASYVAEYENLTTKIKNGTILYENNKERLEELESLISSYDTITRVNNNKVYNLAVNTISNFSKYSCTVYNGELYLGTASITIVNSLEKQNDYTLVINNGSRVYQYDEDGNSPASKALDNPIDIDALSFTIYDSQGNSLSESVVKSDDIAWYVPYENTMITVEGLSGTVDTVNNVIEYVSARTLPYTIDDRYSNTKQQNEITLTVNFKGTTLIAKTALTFVKQGADGTNGTKYVCKIVPNNISSEVTPVNPMITVSASGSYSLNYTPKQSGKWFKVQLWEDGELIFENTATGNSTEGKEATVTWSILKNKYTSVVSDGSSLTLSDSGDFGFGAYSGTSADVVKVNVKYNKVNYVATLPVIVAKISNSNYGISLKDYSGFRYVLYDSDGQNPTYDSTNPFEVIVTQKVNGYTEDISTNTSTYSVDYAWTMQGQYYDYATKAWIESIAFREISDDTLQKNQKIYRPLSEYDGLCVSNALECVVSKSSKEVARIHIPIHLMINRYGLSQLNGWDGNTIQIDEDGGFILSPQMGAGKKESDNSFTGVVMGVVKESGSATEDTGLIGYHEGQRTIFLDAETGSATFGKTGKAQIVLDPTSDKAQLYSGNYSKADKTGLMIDLTTPEIRYGSGNFVVDKDGNLTAVNGDFTGSINTDEGHIGGWTINEDSLSSKNERTVLGSDGSITVKDKSDNDTLSVDSDGNVSIAATYLTIGGKTTKQIASEAVDDLEIGGRNLFRKSALLGNPTLVHNDNTDFTKYLRSYNTNESATFATYDSASDQVTFVLNLNANIGLAFGRLNSEMNLDPTKTYTISCYAKCSNAEKYFSIGLSYYNTSNAWVWRGGQNQTKFEAADTWQKFVLQFTPDKDIQAICYAFTVRGTADGTDTLTIRHCKLEIGNKATAWTPAPEDANDYVDDSLSTYASKVTKDVQNLQTQIDGNITTWYYDYQPTMTNEPASTWTDEDTREDHEGDLFYWKSKGYAYRFMKDESTSAWGWVMVQDTDITTAIGAAQDAQDTADNKRRVFVISPTPPYDIGDLWTEGSSGDLYRCKTARAKGYTSTDYTKDWELATKYTDDSNFNSWVQNDFAEIVTDMKARADAKIQTWYQDTDPTRGSDWDTTEDHTGDIWYDTLNSLSYRYGNLGWEQIDTNPPQAILDTLDGKAQVFIVQPTTPYDSGDLWILQEDTTVDGTEYKKGEILTCVTARSSGNYTAGDWTKKVNYTDDTAANAAQETADEAKELAEKATGLYFQLTNDYETIPADADGNIIGTISASTGVSVYYGHTDITSQLDGSTAFTFKTANVTGSWNASTKVYTIKTLTADKGYVDITVTYMNTLKRTQRFNVAKLKAGDPGTTIKTVTNYYLISASSSGVTSSTSGWTTDVQTPTSEKPYLWNYEAVIDSNDDEISRTEPCIIGNYAERGSSFAWNLLHDTEGLTSWAKSSNVTIDDGVAAFAETTTLSWNNISSTNQPILLKDILNKKLTLQVEARSDTAYTAGRGLLAVVALCTGDSLTRTLYGNPGIANQAGNLRYPSDISDTWQKFSCTFVVTEDGIIREGDTTATAWSGTGTIDDNTRMYIQFYNYSLGDLSLNYPKLAIETIASEWSPAQDEIIGDNGRGILNITEYYAVSASNTTAPTSWSTIVQTTTSTNKYLWNYEVINYDDNTSEETAKRIIGTYGDTGVAGRTYWVEISTQTIKRAKDGTLTPSTFTVSAYYRDGNDATKTPYSGGTLYIEASKDGTTWTGIYFDINTSSCTGELTDSDIETDTDYQFVRGRVTSGIVTLDYEVASIMFDTSLTKLDIVELLSNDGEDKGIYYNDTTGDMYISMSAMIGGSLRLGGKANGYGEMYIYDEDNNEVGSWNRNGIKAIAGTIGGWTIDDDSLYTSGGYNSSTTGSAYLGANGISVTNKFVVNSKGELTSTAGKIGGWTIDDTGLKLGGGYKSSTDGSAYLGSDGISVNNKFYVTNAGYLHAVDAYIENGSYSSDNTSAGFTLSSDGVLTASQAVISGSITAESGKIGGWTIGKTSLYSGTDSTNQTNSNGFVGFSTANFTRTIGSVSRSNLRLAIGSGFGVDYTGKLYASGAVISGAITATSLTLGSSVSIDASDIDGLSPVATSGNASDIDGLAPVATSGSYDSLTGKPTIPDTSTFYKVGTTIGKTAAVGADSFTVSSDGLLTASNAVIYGTIYASKGEFMGTVKAEKLYAKNGLYLTYQSSFGSTDYRMIGFANDSSSNSSGLLYLGVDKTGESGRTEVWANIQMPRFKGTYRGYNDYRYTFNDEVTFDEGAYLNKIWGDLDMATGDITVGGATIAQSSDACAVRPNGNANRSYCGNNSYAWDYVYGDEFHTGEIYSTAANGLMITYSSNRVFFRNDGNAFYILLGTSSGFNSYRPFYINFGDGYVYVKTALVTPHGEVTVSDERKKNIKGKILDDNKYFNWFMSLQPIVYTLKEDNDNKFHFGLGAQTTEQVAKESGIDPDEYNIVTKDSSDEYGVTYGEAQMLTMAVTQQNVSKIEVLEKEIEALKAEIKALKKEIK